MTDEELAEAIAEMRQRQEQERLARIMFGLESE